MKQKLRISLKTATRNIEAVLSRATPEDRAEGLDWYWRARDEAAQMAAHYGVQLRLACHIIAVLSPGVRWETNLDAAAQVLNRETKIKGVYKANAKKAIEIWNTYADECDAMPDKNAPVPHPRCYSILSGPKVTAFAETMFNPSGADVAVVLDAHAISIALGKRYTVKSVPELRKAEREILDKAYRKVAERHGIKAHQVQAITWVRWRKEA